MLGQVFRGALADVSHAKPEQEARQRGVLRFLERVDDVLRRLVRHAIQPGQRGETELVQIGQGANQIGVDQLLDQLVAQAFDLDRAACREVQYRLFALGRAEQAAGATIVDFVLFAHRIGAADRALARHGEDRAALRFRQRGAVGREADDLGNHVARATHDDRVADAHVLASGLVFVVQRGVGHRHAADKHRRQFGNRRELAGAADLDLDRQHLRQLLLRRVLVRHRPTRLSRHEAELSLQLDAVDLVDHAVDVVRQGVALAPDVLVERDQLDSACRTRRLRGDRKAPGMKLLQPVELRRAIRPALIGR